MKRRFMTTTDKVDFNINNYLTIEALEDELTIRFQQGMEYCIDGDGNWIGVGIGGSGTTLSISTGQTISFRGELTSNASGKYTFSISKKCNLKGNCMSILFGDNAANNYSLSGRGYAFYKLFYNCTTIQSVSADFLPATILENDCYNSMFYGCTSLTTAPELPATTLAGGCYDSMFEGCTSLTTAPSLPATTLVEDCYLEMFEGCSKLNYIKMLATDISASRCLRYWVRGVASTGTFVKNAAMTSLPTGVNGIPSGWTVQNA